jgi:hypothetical protein
MSVPIPDSGIPAVQHPPEPEMHSQVVESWERPLTPNERSFISRVRRIMPKAMIAGLDEGFGLDYRILGLSALALMLLNFEPPATSYTFNNIPRDWQELVLQGVTREILLFMQAKYSLIDISYSDSGFSINVDRGAKLNVLADKILSEYRQNCTNAKNATMIQNVVVMGYPRFQGPDARMSMMLGDSAWGWNMP